MQIPVWIKPAVWGGVVGAAAIMIVAFNTGWIVTGGAAAEQAETEAGRAVVAALTPVCVAQFRLASADQRQTHLAALEDIDDWKQSDYVEEQGWATMPGSETPNDDVAETCAEALLKAAEA